MRTDTPKTIYLKDYKSYPFMIEHIDLNFDIHDGYTLVTAKTKFLRRSQEREDLFLHGEDLLLEQITLEGRSLSSGDYTLTEGGMSLPCPAEERFEIEIVTRIYPEKNTRLEGLYQSGGTYCTQCEAEGFRRITYYPDRPDVMTTFTTRVEASEKTCPVLLSNGNKVEAGKTASGRHYTVWNDPFPKPCYLFALVAGNLAHIHDTFKTRSGCNVDLYIYVRHGDEPQCGHAMESLKKSMKWDEEVYGLEYDLDLFNIVAVSDFNMGAMENKSLNIFNTALVLAQQQTATDGDFMRVESVVAHEYFHNWSGNRITCRDWFQLSLKEGLTVFRDQEFSADLHSRTVQRIDDVTHLRRLQFPEDAGPLSHPIRPDNYIEINNFYTMTVYEKGAEVIRMMRTLLGPQNYRKATDLYFSRHDGQAATCDDFVKCMEDASGYDLSQFKLWYSQAGTPEISFIEGYDAASKTYEITLEQKIPVTPGQHNKKPMHIPVAIGLLNDNGDDMDLGGGTFTKILDLKDDKQSFVFKNIASKPLPSVLRNFSAPVKLKHNMPDKDLAFLMVNDSDGFNMWEAGQTLALRTINALIDGDISVPVSYLDAFGAVIDQALHPDCDKALMARCLSLPDLSFIGQSRKSVDPTKIYEASEKIRLSVAEKYQSQLRQIYDLNRTPEQFSITAAAMGQRALQNCVLGILDDISLAAQQYSNANNMTDRVAALLLLADHENAERPKAFADFYQRFQSFPLVVDKWFSLQAAAVRANIVQELKQLRNHPDFNIRNPNRARSLFGAFAMNNPVCFHAADGSGYEFLTDAVIELNVINPQISARLLTPLREWRRYTPDRQEKMRACLEKILKIQGLSPDVFEIVNKTLQ